MLGSKEEFERANNQDDDGDDIMEENNRLDLAESQAVDCREEGSNE